MKLRSWINNNSGLATILAVIILVAALVYLFVSSSGRRVKRADAQWFYDLKTGELFETSLGEYPPIDTQSGEGQGVKAMVYACTDDCELDRQIAWLEKYTPEAKTQLLNLDAERAETGAAPGAIMHPEEDAGRLYARVEEPDKWYRPNSRQGAALMMSIRTLCGEGVRPMMCDP